MDTNMEQYVRERDGGYYVAGSRISLDSVVHPFKNGASPESILRSFPLIGSLEKSTGPSRSTWRIGKTWTLTSANKSGCLRSWRPHNPRLPTVSRRSCTGHGKKLSRGSVAGPFPGRR